MTTTTTLYCDIRKPIQTTMTTLNMQHQPSQNYRASTQVESSTSKLQLLICKQSKQSESKQTTINLDNLLQNEKCSQTLFSRIVIIKTN